MKRYKYSLLLLIPFTVLVSCKKSAFVDANISPSTLASVDPSAQFLYASRSLPNDFEYYYDVLRDVNAWMQFSTGGTGNGSGFNIPGAHFNYRYGNYYGNVGTPLADIPHLIAKMSTADQALRVNEAAVASIYMAYYAFYVSDINGSIPYSQAFKARYGGTLTPTYDTQQSLFDTLDTQIKAAVTALEGNLAGQKSYGNSDPFYGGDPTHWIKAGNALRLKIAMRLMKRDPAKLKSIATEVLADANQMSGIADSWVLLVGPTYADASGNYNPTGFLAAKPVVDFMNTTSDPRIGIFYRKNSFGVYAGSPTSPDICALPVNQALYTAKDTPFSQLQHRLFTPNFDENDGNGAGKGVGFFPVLTYAEYCFIRAELGARSITSDNAGTWYTNGVTASITFYDAMATAAGIAGYTSVTGKISNYLLQTGVAFDPTKAVEQIACQANLNFFRQPLEAWAWWKRTGFPNTTSVLAWSPLTASGATLPLARRASLVLFSTADANYANQKAAYDAMATDPSFLTPDNALGRVWWDMP
ncbi:MAG TPA: SusD/RagB family nutrient-binding outer membrane lipoprotein [Puia sp.]